MHKTVSRFFVLALAVMALMMLVGSVAAAPYPFPYANGFENPGDVSAVCCTGDDVMFSVSRVASGTNGVTSAAGSYHATVATNAGSFTRFGGYQSVFPTGGYETSIDIYLDMAESPVGADKRLDWSSAISQPNGAHRRDFIFSIGTDGLGNFIMSASNNAPGWPANPERNPYTIATTGWYTFRHVFYDDGNGVLAVDMSVLDANGTVLETWTLSDPTDEIGVTVGGNRYGWLVNNAFDALPIDNVTRSGANPPTVSNVLADPNPVAAGTLFTLKADANDAANNILSAEYSLSGSSSPMNASDGMFDSIFEALTAQVTAPVEAGLYEVCVTATNTVYLTSEPECVQIVVYDPSGGFVTGGGWIWSPAGATPLGIVRDGIAMDEQWVFNAEPPFITPASFTTEEASTGIGSLQVEPITNVPDNRSKFILRYVPTIETLLSELDSFAIDFLIDDAGTSYNASQFYINLYALTPDPNDGSWYDCRFDYVAGSGSTSDWTALTVDSSIVATAVGDKIGGACPSSYAGMPLGSTLLFLSVNLGDTSGNDTGVGGYFDNAVMSIGGTSTTWDFGETLTGRANFGFVSKYKKGADTPDGSTQFSFQAGNLNFHSTSYDWLVVNQNDSNAQYKGQGTINGMGDYKFKLWAGDHDTGDTFRIKIWEEVNGSENVVYDNGTYQLIGGGNILVHKPACKNCAGK